MTDRPTAAILIGGQSRRMGSDKALLDFRGRPLARWTAELARPHASSVFLVAGEPERYADLGLPVVPDVHPGVGALGGLHAALSASATERCLVLACDLPLLPAVLLERLTRPTEADLVIPRTSERLQPLCALYSKTCLGPMEELIARGGRRIIDFYHQVTVEELPVEPGSPLDPAGTAFFNVNAAADLEKARELADREGDHATHRGRRR